MEIVTVVKCDESEIIDLIHQKLGITKFDGIVACEEIGNQYWTTTVYKASDNDIKEVEKAIASNSWQDIKYRTRLFMNYLCLKGHLQKGDYIVDCTW
jgi:hypothetical protein